MQTEIQELIESMAQDYADNEQTTDIEQAYSDGAYDIVQRLAEQLQS